MLHYFLDGLRQEELNRFKKAFFQHFNDQNFETNKELILQYKGLIEGAARPILDSVFGGVLQQSIKCLNCGFIHISYEHFLDLSLSVLKPEIINKKVQFSKKKWKQDEVQKNDNKISKHMKKKELKNKKKVNFCKQ